MLRIGIVGSRDYPVLEDVDEYLSSVLKLVPCLHIINGGARGVDKRSSHWALRRGIQYEEIEPIDPPIKNIGLMLLCRNVEILSKADIIVAFWDGKSPGTKFVIDYCNARGKYLLVKKHE